METQLLHLLQLVFHPISTPIIFAIIVVLVLLFCSAMVSGSEVAFFSLSPAENEELVSREGRSSKLVMELLSKPEKLLANILISNNFINVGIVILSSFITNSLMDAAGAPALGFIIQVVIITFMILLFGEILPKIYAERFSVGFALIMAFPLSITGRLFKPLILLLTRFTTLMSRRSAKRKMNISMDDLSEALDIATDVFSEEKKMLAGIVNFSTLEASEIMKPRMDVTIIDVNITDRKSVV